MFHKPMDVSIEESHKLNESPKRDNHHILYLIDLLCNRLELKSCHELFDNLVCFRERKPVWPGRFTYDVSQINKENSKLYNIGCGDSISKEINGFLEELFIDIFNDNRLITINDEIKFNTVYDIIDCFYSQFATQLLHLDCRGSVYNKVSLTDKVKMEYQEFCRNNSFFVYTGNRTNYCIFYIDYDKYNNKLKSLNEINSCFIDNFLRFFKYPLCYLYDRLPTKFEILDKYINEINISLRKSIAEIYKIKNKIDAQDFEVIKNGINSYVEKLNEIYETNSLEVDSDIEYLSRI